MLRSKNFRQIITNYLTFINLYFERLIADLVSQRKEILLIRALKILKVTVDNHKELILEEIKYSNRNVLHKFKVMNKLS